MLAIRKTISNMLSRKMSFAYIESLVKALFFGVASIESLYFISLIRDRLGRNIIEQGYEIPSLIGILFCTFLLIVYLFSRDFLKDVKKVLFSLRVDFFAVVLFGGSISFVFDGLGGDYYVKAVSWFSDSQLIALMIFPFFLITALIFRLAQIELKKKREKPFFVSDSEQESKSEDLLDFAELADNFAERVFNQGSSDSLVFGIDAPWGTGKSSFVNFCREYWANRHQGKAIVYNFNPLKFEDREHLLEKFIDGLVREIQKEVFIPEIRPLIYKYSRFFKAKASFSFWGIEFFSGAYTVDDAFEDLESVLGALDRKLIVVIDDLDRLNFTSIKEVLFAIKKSFTLPNISYVLCYDTENISVFDQGESDTEKVIEFLEKFVNVKISLYLDSDILKKYVSSNLEVALSGNSQADPKLVSKALSGLVEILESNNYHRYIPFIGDVRKIKRLINTLLLLDIEKTDFDNSDFNNHDLVHLLLIYINYPNIFRKIYNTETQGRRGFFSAILPYEEGVSSQEIDRNSYQNSKSYKDYVKSLSSENQKFLLNQVFNIKTRLETTNIDSVDPSVSRSYACFNGVWSSGKNLEEYLHLIVKLSKPQKHSQYYFYLNCKNNLIDGGDIEEILSQEAFSFSNTENNRQQLWNVLTNSAREFDKEISANVIRYILKNISDYSLFSDGDISVGLRDHLVASLVLILDSAGWTDENGLHRNNTDENVEEIAEWVFGEKRHSDSGVIKLLGSENRGVLGLYDLLGFRLHCSADRGGHIFNLERALAKHGNPSAPTQGSTKIIAVEEMRKISQHVFSIFNNQYIGKKSNLFDLIDSLSLEELCGEYYQYVTSEIDGGGIENWEIRVLSLKSRLKSFIIYQLGNTLVSHGVGCGYYDPEGSKDGQIISERMNDYLFDVCFNSENAPKNYEHFVDYLLINFAWVLGNHSGERYKPSITEFTKVLKKERLIEYWKNNETSVRNLKLEEKDKVVYTSNYNVSYKDNLPEVFEMLDSLLVEPDQKD